LQSILRISPDFDELKDFCFKSAIDIIEVFSADVRDKNNNFRTRVFAPTFGYMEDPATGSGNSAFGYYLNRLDKWNKPTILIEQNGLPDNFNIIKLRRSRDEQERIRVWFGGGAITRINGEYILY